MKSWNDDDEWMDGWKEGWMNKKENKKRNRKFFYEGINYRCVGLKWLDKGKVFYFLNFNL